MQKGVVDRATAKYNERYFVNVFHSLKYCDQPEILFNILKIINYYTNIHTDAIMDDQLCRRSIINPDLIIWMLQIMDSNKDCKNLCCVCSLILLQIVEKHNEMEIEYQEQAIISLFNRVLCNIGVFDHYVEEKEDEIDDGEEEDEIDEIESSQEFSETNSDDDDEELQCSLSESKSRQSRQP